MKNYHNFLLIVLSSIILIMCIQPTTLHAQSIAGKWQTKGYNNQLHFSSDGIFRLQTPEGDFYAYT